MRLLPIFLGLLLLVVTACGGSGPAPSPPVDSSTPTVTIADTPEAARTPVATATSAQASRTPSPASTPAPRAEASATPVATTALEPDLAFHFGDDVSVFERTLIITAIDVTRDLLATDAGIEPPVSVFAYRSTSELSQAFAAGARAQNWRATGMAQRLSNGVAEASYRGVAINTGSTAWGSLSDSQLMRAVAHEYVHVVQLEKAGLGIAEATLAAPPDAVPPAGPYWLLEGSAEVISWRVAEQLQLGDYNRTMEQLAGPASTDRDDLSHTETYLEFAASGQPGLAKSVLATDYLLHNRDVSELFNFWQDIRDGATWEAAFIRRFGVSAQAFYASFEDYLSQTFKR